MSVLKIFNTATFVYLYITILQNLLKNPYSLFLEQGQQASWLKLVSKKTIEWILRIKLQML